MGGHSQTSTAVNGTWGRGARCLASLLIAGQLFAVVIGPLSFPPSPLTGRLRELVQPYLDAAFLNHGYKFFAPDPGPSHIIRWEMILPDGTRREGIFPDPKEHWPRLLYHRHFMLSEFVNAGPPDPSWELEPDWERLKPSAWQRRYAGSYAHHLLSEYGGRSVTLYLREHLIPPPDYFTDYATGRAAANGAHLPVPAKPPRLDDPRFYRERSLGTYTGEAS